MGNVMISLEDDNELLLRKLAQELYQGKKGSLSEIVSKALEEFAEKRNSDNEKKSASERILQRIEKGENFGLGLKENSKVYEQREELYEKRIKKILGH